MPSVKTLAPYLRGLLIGIALIVALNSFDMVLTVNVWPSVLTAQGDL